MTRQVIAACGLLGAFLVAELSIFAATAQKPAASTPGNPFEAARANNLGAAYMNQQLFEKGLKAFRDAAALDPSLQIARLNQGIAQLNLTRLDAAKLLLDEAAKRASNDPHAWYNLGLLFKNSGDAQGAVEAFRRVTEIDPNDADTWYFLGASYSQDKKFPQAIEAFQHALKINPLHASAEFGLARAYQQSGDATQAREHLARFQHITQEKLGNPIGLAYGDQGKYSLTEESPLAPEKVPPQIPVKFVDVTEQAGIVSKPAASRALDPVSDRISVLGTGACFLDYDGDGKIDLFLADNGPQGGMALYHNLGNGKFEDVTKKAGLDASLHALSCTAGDYDNDGATDLAVSDRFKVLLLHNEKNGTFKDVTKASGILVGDETLPAESRFGKPANFGLTFIDYDHDGDLDLYVTRARVNSRGGVGPLFDNSWSGNVMFRNNGNGGFTNVTESVGLVGLGASTAAIGTDYNNDRAVDIVIAGFGPRPPVGGIDITAAGFPEPPVKSDPVSIYLNPREGAFGPVDSTNHTSMFVPKTNFGSKDTFGVTALDFNHDGWMDLALTYWAWPGLTLWRNNQGKSFERVDLPKTDWVHSFGVAAIDYDNDGWVDLVAAGETADGKGEVRLFRNLGPDGWKDVSSDVGLDKIQFKEPRAIITGDYDNDGATDLLITQNHGPAILLRNEGGNKNNWLRLNLKGLADNKSAIGTKVEVLSDGIRQKFEIAGSNGYLGQNSPYLTVGLGQAKEADVVRMLWPSGVLQDEIEVEGRKEHSFVEMDRRGSSCPTLFVWDGHHYVLVADMLGDGVIGHWVGPGQRNIPRPTEYMKIDRSAMREKNGKLSFRFMEPLEEAVYLDQVKLLAIDHPADFEVFPNEYFASNPPFPAFKVVFSRDARPPAGAWDDGRDVLPDLIVHHYFGNFGLGPFQGFAEMHTLELDLGEPYRGGPLWLMMHGEIEYFTATSMFAAYQAGLEPVSPYLEAQDASGKWVRVVDDLGFPAGGARTMTADLSGKLPEGTQRVRILTNLQIYWDNILINRTDQGQQSQITPVPLARADLRFHGFPLKIEDQPPGNVKYNYENASATGPYTRPAGAYTRYGDVLPLLNSFDDRLVVFGSGDEVALDFDPAKLPALPKGWTRDYFFVANGYEKDMDFYAAESSTVDPLPFRGMGTYPYAKGKLLPLDNLRMDDLLNYDTRYVSGKEPQGYRFNYPPQVPQQKEGKH